MLRSVLKRTPLARALPLTQLLLAGELALMAGRQVRRLTPAQRRRLLTLVRRGSPRPGALSAAERRELSELIALLQPRLLLGSAVRRLSPVPVPRRLLYGPRGSAAREAAAARR